MHSYAIESHEQRRVYFVLVALSIVSAWVLHAVLQFFELSVPWFIDAPAVMGFYEIYIELFERWAWRQKFARALRLSTVRDISGKWTGNIRTSFEQHALPHPCQVEIRQTWTRMSISLRTAHSNSHSLTAAVSSEQDGQISVTYEYINEPQSASPHTMQAHRGTAHLASAGVDKPNVLEGEYYSGRGRQNYGSLYLERQATQ